MDFMKVIDQTVREIKREVNLKVLKVPEMEQKVLDATDDEPWGPHGTALADIAQATKKFSECQMVMNVLWTRLTETGKNWRFVYKGLAVIEYLVAHGSERAVDDIIEHTFQISSLASFEFVEPSGKDVGINVRKKAETIVALLNDKDKIQEVRNKASANRDKYFGLSSTGITYKSGNASFSSSSFQSGDRYGGFGSTKDSDSSRDSYRNTDRYDDDKFDHSSSVKSRRDSANNLGDTSRKGSTRKGSETRSADASKTTTKINEPDKYGSIPTQSSIATTNNYDDDFDDFDPRGTSGAKPSTGTSHQVDLFGQDLLGDLLDAPIPVPTEKSAAKPDQSEVDLFADASFVSAASPMEAVENFDAQKNVDLFSSQPAPPAALSPTVDFFSAPDAVAESDKKSTNPEQMTSNAVDPFAAVPLNNFDASDPFGAFAQNPAIDSSPSSSNGSLFDTKPGSQSNLAGSSVDSKPPTKKGAFQVKSGVWADSLNRGLIDLNITAPKKVNLADVGIVGGLTDGSDEKVKAPPTSFYMGGRAIGAGSGLGKPGISSASSEGDDFFSSLSSQQYQFAGFKK